MLSENPNSFLRPLKHEDFKEEYGRKIGFYGIVESTTLESNKSLADYTRFGSLNG
jgi:hypothetical protein